MYSYTLMATDFYVHVQCAPGLCRTSQWVQSCYHCRPACLWPTLYLYVFLTMFLALTGALCRPPFSNYFLLTLSLTLSHSLSQLCCRVTCDSVLLSIPYSLEDHCGWSTWQLRHEKISSNTCCLLGWVWQLGH